MHVCSCMMVRKDTIFYIKTGWVKYENHSTYTVIKVKYSVSGRLSNIRKKELLTATAAKARYFTCRQLYIKRKHVPTSSVAYWWSSLKVKASHKLYFPWLLNTSLEAFSAGFFNGRVGPRWQQPLANTREGLRAISDVTRWLGEV